MYSDPCGTCVHRWYLLGLVDCEKCKDKSTAEKWTDYAKEAVDSSVQGFAIAAYPPGIGVVAAHYLRNTFNTTYSSEAELSSAYTPLSEDEDKFHQNNQAGGRNRKYVIGDWFSSEAVFYSDGTLNDTPEDKGTFNVYYGDSKILNVLVHGTLDVIPYMIWGNSPSDTTTIVDRLIMALE